jgi:predicted permease
MSPEWLGRLRALIGRRRHEADLAEELRYHLEREATRNRERGMSPSAARAAAARAFGNVAEVQETVRTGWGWRWLGDLGQDTRFALRAYRREPILVLTVLLAIGLGVGINTAYFTFFNTYFLKPFPVADPQSLYRIEWTGRDRAGHGFSWSQYRDLERLPIIAASFGFRRLQSHVDRRPIRGTLVTESYFRMLGVGPAVGRVLGPGDEDSAAAGRSAVLSYRAWEVRFAKDPSVIGRTLLIRGQPLEIVGVAQAGFSGVDVVPTEFWAPLRLARRLNPGPDPFGLEGGELLNVVARFRSSASLEAAKRDLTRWVGQRLPARLDGERFVGVELPSNETAQRFTPAMFGAIAPTLIAFVLVLLAACANVASALVARGAARQRELAIRLSLGAGRGRVVRQLMTESVLLTVPAALTGLVVSQLALTAGARVMTRTMPEAFQPMVALAPLTPDHRVLAFSLLAALGSALLFGLAPALQATRPEIVRAARGESSVGFRSPRLRRGLVIGQITIAALLLVAAGVLLRGTTRTRTRDLGFDPAGVVALDLEERFRAATIERLRLTPGVRAVAGTSQIPLEGPLPRVDVGTGGSPTVAAAWIRVSPEFFQVLSIDLVAGRPFGDQDIGAPAAIVNQTLAASLWRGAAAVDRTIQLEPGGSVRVVGVARDVIGVWIGDPVHRPIVYLPMALASAGSRIVVRSDGSADRTRRLLERELAVVDPAAVEQAHTLNESVAFSVWPIRAAYWFAEVVGAVALVLTVTGVYGVLAFVVARRTREIGIRTALGASRAGIVSLVLGESARLAGIGIGLGAVLAAVLGRLAASRLETINPFEPIAYLAGAGAVLVACLAGAAIPSQRAATVAPVEALRAD